MIYYIDSKFNYEYLFIALYLLKNYCRAFDRLLVRYISINYFMNIFFIAFLLGLNGILYLFIRRLIDPDFIELPDFSKNIHFLFIFFISSVGNFFIYYKIIYKLGPIHAYVSDLIAIIISNTIFEIKQKVVTFKHLIIMIVFLISMFIYYETIQFNFCNLNKNTKKKISERGIDDTKNLMQNSVLSNDDNDEYL